MTNLLSLKDILPEPYLSMLTDLKEHLGYEEYIRMLTSIKDSEINSYKAEIKALYELHISGYLKKIESPSIANGKSSPDGLLEIEVQGVVYKGILEVAFIKYLFDSDSTTQTTLNKVLNVKKNIEFTSQLPEKKLVIYKTKFGSAVIGENKDINQKVVDIYRIKRDQHRSHFPDFPEYIKIYYFLIDCPPTKLATVDQRRLMGRMHKGEIIIISSVYSEAGQKKHSVITLTRELEIVLDISNKYFGF